jgi:hypothetical protein
LPSDLAVHQLTLLSFQLEVRFANKRGFGLTMEKNLRDFTFVVSALLILACGIEPVSLAVCPGVLDR